MTPRAISAERGAWFDRVLTASALIEQGLTTSTSVVMCPRLTIDGQTFKDAFEHGAQRHFGHYS